MADGVGEINVDVDPLFAVIEILDSIINVSTFCELLIHL